MSAFFRAYPLLRPALFALEPETAHALIALSAGDTVPFIELDWNASKENNAIEVKASAANDNLIFFITTPSFQSLQFILFIYYQ